MKGTWTTIGFSCAAIVAAALGIALFGVAARGVWLDSPNEAGVFGNYSLTEYCLGVTIESRVIYDECWNKSAVCAGDGADSPSCAQLSAGTANLGLLSAGIALLALAIAASALSMFVRPEWFTKISPAAAAFALLLPIVGLSVLHNQLEATQSLDLYKSYVVTRMPTIQVSAIVITGFALILSVLAAIFHYRSGSVRRGYEDI